MAYHGEEKGTAETLTMEQVLPALPPEGVAPPGDANESSQSQGVGPKEVWGNLVAHLWKFGLLDPIAIEDVFAVDSVPLLCGSFGVRKETFKNVFLQYGEPAYPLKLIMNLVPTSSAPTEPTWISSPFLYRSVCWLLVLAQLLLVFVFSF